MDLSQIIGQAQQKIDEADAATILGSHKNAAAALHEALALLSQVPETQRSEKMRQLEATVETKQLTIENIITRIKYTIKE